MGGAGQGGRGAEVADQALKESSSTPARFCISDGARPPGLTSERREPLAYSPNEMWTTDHEGESEEQSAAHEQHSRWGLPYLNSEVLNVRMTGRGHDSVDCDVKFLCHGVEYSSGSRVAAGLGRAWTRNAGRRQAVGATCTGSGCRRRGCLLALQQRNTRSNRWSALLALHAECDGPCLSDSQVGEDLLAIVGAPTGTRTCSCLSAAGLRPVVRGKRIEWANEQLLALTTVAARSRRVELLVA